MKKRDDVVTRVVTAESCLLQDVERGICSTPLTVQAALSLSSNEASFSASMEYNWRHRSDF